MSCAVHVERGGVVQGNCPDAAVAAKYGNEMRCARISHLGYTYVQKPDGW